ncbi:MAG TPA: LytTR family DNA-binding domain-containing protein [Saprospiraceae bacterium]|nr:LytTR family DNA-binding domain-containing protein [Saprospiraceae bacterium]HMP12768.1 LytTR family DNA-binding domain-containing protein [Saprospiraceae bacterium]
MVLSIQPDSSNVEGSGGSVQHNDIFFIRQQHALLRMRFSDIRWIHADGNYCYLHSKDRKYVVKSSLRKIISHLPPQEFIQIHKSYIVRFAAIEKIDIRDNIIGIGADNLPMGRKYKEHLLTLLNII